MSLRKKLNLPRVRIGQVRSGLVECQPEFLIGSHFMTLSPVTNCLPRGPEFNLSSFKMFFSLLGDEVVGTSLAPGGAVAEWSKALQLRDKINKNKKDHRFAPQPGDPLKKLITC